MRSWRDQSSSGQFEKHRQTVSAPQAPLDGVASPEEEVIPVLLGNRDEMATRGHWVWMESLDFQAPKGKRVHQETLAPREIQGKMELLGLQGPQDPLGPGALLATPGKMAPGEHQAQWVPKEKLDKMVQRAQVDPQGPRGMMGYQANQGSLDPQGPRGSPATQALMEPRGSGVPQASRVNKETQW